MKILTPGHKYELANFQERDLPGQVLQFIEKRPAKPDEIADPGGPTTIPLITVNDGTTNEELMRVLIDRMTFLFKKMPSEETACSIMHLKEALYAQQSRTYEHSARGVEGTHTP